MQYLRNAWTVLAQNASPLEAAVAIIALVGVPFAFWTVVDAVAQARSMPTDINGVGTYIINGQLRRHVNRLIVITFWGVVGVVSMILPPAEPPDAASQTERARLVWLWVMFVRGGILCAIARDAVDAIMDVVDLRRLVRALRARPTP